MSLIAILLLGVGILFMLISMVLVIAGYDYPCSNVSVTHVDDWIMNGSSANIL